MLNGKNPKSQLEKRIDALEKRGGGTGGDVPAVYFQSTDPSIDHTVNDGDYFFYIDNNTYLKSIWRRENGMWELKCTITSGGSGTIINIDHAILVQKDDVT